MSGNVYTAVFEEVTATLAQDLFELLAPNDVCLELISARVGQSSDPADAQAEMAAISIVRGVGTVTSGSGGGTNPTPRPTHQGGAASGSTVEINNTTKMVVGTGALEILLNDDFNMQVGWLYQPVPEERFYVSPSDRVTIELVNAPADALTISGTISWREIGG